MTNEALAFLSFEVEDTLKKVGLLLRQARLARNLSETQMAERLRVSRSTWVRIEAGDSNVRSGTLLQALKLNEMSSRVLDLANPDPIVAQMALQALEKRGSARRKKTQSKKSEHQGGDVEIE